MIHDHTCSDACAASEEHMQAMDEDAWRQIHEADSDDAEVLSWTQPICEAKFQELKPGATPVRLVPLPGEELDKCCFCLTPTTIYYRLDPKTVPYPRKERE